MAIPTAGQLGSSLNSLPPTFLLVGAGILAVFYYAYTNVDRRAFQEFEKKPLGQKVFEDLKFRIKKIGKETDKTLYDISEMEQKDQIGFYDTYEIREDNPILPNTELSKSDKEDLDNVIILMTAPSKEGLAGKIKYAKWMLFDYLDETGGGTIYILNEEHIEKRENHFVYGNEVQFLPISYTGLNSQIMCQSTQRSVNVINQIATADMEGKMLNSMTEFLDKVEHFEIEHLKRIGEMDKEAEIEQARQEGLID